MRNGSGAEEQPADGPPDPAPGEEPPAAEPADPVPPPVDEAAERERRAKAISEQAWSDARSGQWGRARELLRLLLGVMAATDTVKGQREELEALDRLAILEVEGPLGLLHGEIERLGDDRIRILYDFRDREQAKDWRFLGAFAVPDKGTFEPSSRETLVRGKGAGAYVLDLVLEGDLQMAFRVRSPAPHDLGALMFELNDEYHHIMYTFHNTFFTLGKERSALPGNCVMLWGPGTWAKDHFGELGFVRVAQADTPVLPADTWTYVAVGRTKEQAFLSIGNERISGRTRGDDDRLFGDLRPALFVLRTEAEFAEVSIEGRPSRAWVASDKKRLREILGLE
jgi:hypothetical protein